MRIGIAAIAAGPLIGRATDALGRPRLVLASFLMLFVELALIRWTSANNLYLVHLTNFVLLASFLGIGLGFLLAPINADRASYLPAAFLLAMLAAFLQRHRGGRIERVTTLAASGGVIAMLVSGLIPVDLEEAMDKARRFVEVMAKREF